MCVCSDDEDCLIINFFYGLQPLHIFDDVWNGIRFIRWGLKRKSIWKEITDLHIWRLFSYSMFIFIEDRFFNCKHIHTYDHLLIMIISTFRRYNVNFFLKRKKKNKKKKKICCTLKYTNLHRLETPWDVRFTHK